MKTRVKRRRHKPRSFELRVLSVLLKYPGADSWECSDYLDRSDADVSDAMNRLEDMGLIDASNRPTEKGHLACS